MEHQDTNTNITHEQLRQKLAELDARITEVEALKADALALQPRRVKRQWNTLQTEAPAVYVALQEALGIMHEKRRQRVITGGEFAHYLKRMDSVTPLTTPETVSILLQDIGKGIIRRRGKVLYVIGETPEGKRFR